MISATEAPLYSFFKRLLDPFIIVGVLYCLTVLNDELFSGYYLVLIIIAFFIATFVYEQFDHARTWRDQSIFFHARDIFSGWVIIAGIIYFIGYASALSYQFLGTVMLEWFVITPFVLLLSHLIARKITINMRKGGEIRTAVLVGASEAGLRIANRIADNPGLMMGLNGYFEDRDLSRNPKGLDATFLGKLQDAAAYVREHNIQMVFICQNLVVM